MLNISPAITIILAEASVLLTLLCIFLIFKHFKHHRNDQKAILSLSSNIQNNADERKKMLRSFLAETCNYDDDAAQQTSDMLINTEKLFYNTIISLYKNRDANALKNLDSNTEHMIDAYRNLTSSATAALRTKLEQEKSEQHEQLEQHNQTLTNELEKLKSEMDSTVNEFTSAFHQGPNADEQDGADTGNNPDTSPMIDEDIQANTDDAIFPMNTASGASKFT